MKAKRMRPPFLRVVGRNERAPLYCIRGPGMQPAELWELESRIVISPVAWCDPLRHPFANESAERLLSRLGSTYVTRSGRTVFVVRCLAVEPEIRDRTLELLYTISAHDSGRSIKEAKRRLKLTLRSAAGALQTGKPFPTKLELPEPCPGKVVMLLNIKYDREAHERAVHELRSRTDSAYLVPRARQQQASRQ